MKPRPGNQKKPSFYPWVILAVLVAGGAYFLLRDRRDLVPAPIAKILPKRAAKDSVDPPTGTEPAAPSVSEGTGGGGASSGTSGGGGGGIGVRSEYFLCRLGQKGMYLMPRAFMPSLLKPGKHITVLIDDEARCLATGKSFELVFVEYDTIRRVPWRQVHSQRASVAKIEDFPSIAELLQKYSPAQLGFANPYDFYSLMTNAMGSDFQRFPLRAVTWDIPAVAMEKTFSGVPPVHPLADSVSKEEAKSSGGILVDASSVKSDGSIQGVVRFPFSGDGLVRAIVSYASVRSFLRVSNEKIAELLPKDQRLVVFSLNETDGTAYNVVNALHGLGYRNLAFVRGGRFAFSGKSAETPFTAPGITTVEQEKVESLLAAPTPPLLVDVRRVTEFMRGSLPGARTVPYYEARDKTPLQGADMKAAELTASGEGYEVPKGHGEIIFYGFNEFDWKPLKAAVFARDAGLKKVYWYRKGLEDWRFPSMLGKPVKIQQNRGREAYEQAVREQKKLYPGLVYQNLPAGKPDGPRSGGGQVVPAEDKGYLLLTPNVVPPTFRGRPEERE